MPCYMDRPVFEKLKNQKRFTAENAEKKQRPDLMFAGISINCTVVTQMKNGSDDQKGHEFLRFRIAL